MTSMKDPFAEMELDKEDFLTEEELLKDQNLNGIPDIFESIEHQNPAITPLEQEPAIEEISQSDLFDIEGF